VGNRRTLLRAGIALTAVTAARAGGGSTPARACPPIGGDVRCNGEALAAAGRDFGHIVQQRPQAVLRPASSADIAAALRWATSRGVKAAARGQGHSTYGRSMVDGGIVIDMSTMRAIHGVERDRITVDAGASWASVLDAALAHGRTPPVLTNYLDLSVGGTLAVGGVGGTTLGHGLQTDNVLALHVVTGDGREMTCAATENAELFEVVRGGLGQCAIITRATLRLVPAKARVRRYHLAYPDLGSLSADQRKVMADRRFDYLQGGVLQLPGGGWRHQLEGVVFHDGAVDDSTVLAGLSDQRAEAEITDATYREDAQAFARLEKMLRAKGQWTLPHPWLMTFLRGADAETVAGEILAGLSGGDLGAVGRVIYYPLPTAAMRTTLVRLPEDPMTFVFNLVRMPGDAAAATPMVAQNRALYERIRDAGGVQYAVGALPMSREDWQRHFGPAWTKLRDARRRYDPAGVLTPGYELF
jgi:cytokinin dehydrogenase